MLLTSGFVSCVLAFSNLLTAAELPPILNSYEQLPLSFEPNLGQADSRAQFVARSAGYTLFLGPSEAQMVLASVSRNQAAALYMTLDGASPTARPAALERQPGVSAYFIGNDSSRWLPEVPHYGCIQYESVYPGIDIVYYGNGQQVEYDFVLHPGADSSRIRLSYAGAERMRIDSASGDLILTTALGELRQRKPHVYQAAGGRQVEVPTAYRLNGRQVSFDVTHYDRGRPLVIDPVLIYSTYLGGNNRIADMAMDAAGAVYVTGMTTSYNFPAVNAYQPGVAGPARVLFTAFVTKLNPYPGSGQVTLAYSTYLGGSAYDSAKGVAVDSTGAAYVLGTTSSPDFPVLNAYHSTPPSGADGFDGGFVTRLNPYNGSGPVTLSYSTFLGGGIEFETPGKIAVDSAGAAYVAGNVSSENFPSVNALLPFQPGDVFLARFNPYSGTGDVTLGYSTSLGPGSAAAVAVDSTGAVYVAGGAGAAFPTINAYQGAHPANGGAFVTKVNPFTGGPVTVAYSTLLGGSGSNFINAIAVDSAGAAYIAGYTTSTDFPVVNAWQSRNAAAGNGYTDSSANGNAFVVRMNPFSGTGNVTLGFSTYLGGAALDLANGIAVDAAGAVYVTGLTTSANFPVLDPSPPSFSEMLGDAFVTKFIPSKKGPLTLAYSTFIGGNEANPNIATYPTAGTGIAIDPSGAIQLAGYTYSLNFPLLNAYQNTYIDVETDAMTDSDGFAVKIPQPGAVVKTPVDVTVTSPTIASLAPGQAPARGQPLTLTATFTGASSPPVTGRVWFVGGTNGAVLCSAPVSNGGASCTTPAYTPPYIVFDGGGNTITAGYPGDSVYTLGTVTPLTFLNGPAATTTNLSISPNPPVVGPVTLTATVTITQPGGAFQNNDTVKFTQNGFTVCLLSPPPEAIQVTQFTVSCPLTLGSAAVTLSALYSGNTETASSSAGFGYLVPFSSPVPSFDIHVSAAATIYGQPVTISATSVPVPGSALPTGSVTFYDATGSVIGQLASVPLTAGAASITVPANGISALRAGTHSITVNGTGPAYGGATIVVAKADTMTTLAAQGSTVTAAVSAVSPGAGVPSGGVQFFNGSAEVAAGNLVTSGTQSVVVLPATAIGGNITAIYSGDSNFNGSTSAVLSLPKSQPPVFVTLTLASSPNPAPVGLPVTLTVSVKGNAPAPAAGMVQVFDSATLLGAAGVSGGQATLAATFQSTGTHRLAAQYSGDSVYPPESLAAGLYVVGNSISIAIASSSANTIAGQPVTFTAQLDGAVGLAPPSGTVQFLDGATVIATGLVANGAASVTVSSLAPGTHRISAFYGGDAVWASAVSAALIQSVGGGTFTFQQPSVRGR